MALPLVSIGGGEDAIHDWNYLLSAFGLLRYDQTIGGLVHALGLLVMIASVLAGLYLSLQGEDTAQGPRHKAVDLSKHSM